MRNTSRNKWTKAFCYQKLIWRFTVWANCSIDLKICTVFFGTQSETVIWRWKWPSRDSIHLIIMIQTAWVCLWSILFILHEFYKEIPITPIQHLFFIEITYSKQKRASVWYNALTFPKWHFFTKIVLTYCEKKFF